MKIPVIEISPDKADRQRISSADSSTPTVVEGQIDNGDSAKDLGKILFNKCYFGSQAIS